MHCIKDKNNLLTSVITEDYILVKEGNSLPYFNYRAECQLITHRQEMTAQPSLAHEENLCLFLRCPFTPSQCCCFKSEWCIWPIWQEGVQISQRKFHVSL